MGRKAPVLQLHLHPDRWHHPTSLFAVEHHETYGSVMLNRKTLADVFSGSMVLVTGHTGFKGSWLTYMLQELGAKTVGYSIAAPENKNHCYYALGVNERLLNKENALGDVRDLQAYRAVMHHYAPDFVFHLAAQAIVSTSYTSPLSTFHTNCMGIANLLEILRDINAQTTTVIITSDKCYKNKERMHPYSENEEMGGDDPYSASKAAAELIFHSYLKSYFAGSDTIGLATTRAGNVFGGGDWSPNRLIPDCVRDLLDSGVIRVRMPQAIRPWTFVIDVLYGYLNLAYYLRRQPKIYQGSWNFASGETRTVMAICETIIKAFNFGEVRVDSSTYIGKESSLLLIDASKARKELGWRPIYPIDVSIANTAEWYLHQSSGDNMKTYSTYYLESYFEAAGSECV